MTDEWNMYPDYRESVPYQELLSRELRSAFDVNFSSLGTALIERARSGKVVFHLHWQDAIYNRAKSVAEANLSVEAFQKNVAAFKWAGGIFLWTVHNLYPHENPYPEAEKALKEVIIRHSNFIHVHNNTTAKALRELGLHPEKIILYPCPSFADSYPNTVSRADAREYFSLSQSSTVFAFLGMIRKYKGVDILRDAFKRVKARGKDVALILAGQSDNPSKRRFIVADGVHVIPRFIEDSTVQYVFNSADYGVIPYRQITTSAALMLGLGFGKPMIVPSLPQLLDIVTAGKEVLTFDAGNVDELEAILCVACEMSPSKYSEMSRSAFALCDTLTFSSLANALIKRVAVI